MGATRLSGPFALAPALTEPPVLLGVATVAGAGTALLLAIALPLARLAAITSFIMLLVFAAPQRDRDTAGSVTAAPPCE